MLHGLCTILGFFFLCFTSSIFSLISLPYIPSVLNIESSFLVDESQFVIPAEKDTSLLTDSGGSSSKVTRNGSIVFIFLVLGLVLFTAYFFLKFLRKSNSNTVLGSDQDDLIKVIGNYSLKGQIGLYIVEILNYIYILGVSSEGVHLIEKITDKEAIDELKFNSKQRYRNQKRFSHLLSSKLGSMQGVFSKIRTSFDTEKQVKRLKSLSSSNKNNEQLENTDEESHL